MIFHVVDDPMSRSTGSGCASYTTCSTPGLLKNARLQPLMFVDNTVNAMIHLNPAPHFQTGRVNSQPHSAGEVQRELHPQRSVKAQSTEHAKASSDRALIQELQSRDQAVRTHERAHLAASGGLATGGASFQFTRGPDGGLYATGGEVRIDTSPVADDPRATIEKAQQIRRAALAPANPSQQDRAVAAQANAMATEAKIELQRLEREQALTKTEESDSPLEGHSSELDHSTNRENLVALFGANTDHHDMSFDITV